MTRMVRSMVLWMLVGACLSAALPGSEARADPVIATAGDIACDPADPSWNGGAGDGTRCAQRATAAVLAAAPFDALLTLGDHQYNAATPSNFSAAYDPTWGRFKPVTSPVIGDHEGATATSGDGYCQYFGAAAHCNATGQQGGAAYYSFDVGTWHVAVVNSNCAAAGGCDPGTPQYIWLAADLAAHPTACTLVAWHHPRWSSGHGGSHAMTAAIWQLAYDQGADLVLSGHAHDYERFAPLDGAGALDPSYGMRQFVVGTGGAFFTGRLAKAPGSEVFQNTTFGVLRLTLHPAAYDWQFVPVAGRTFADAGTQPCHGVRPPPAPPPPPPPPPAATPPPAPPAAPVTLKRWRLSSRAARRALARRWVFVPRRPWPHARIDVRVGRRLAARRRVRTASPLRIHLARWTARRAYRHRAVTVTARQLP